MLVLSPCEGQRLNLLRVRPVARSRLRLGSFPGEEKERCWGGEAERECGGHLVPPDLLILTFITYTHSVPRVLGTKERVTLGDGGQ